jgi:hypothetical protein
MEIYLFNPIMLIVYIIKTYLFPIVMNHFDHFKLFPQMNRIFRIFQIIITHI